MVGVSPIITIVLKEILVIHLWTLWSQIHFSHKTIQTKVLLNDRKRDLYLLIMVENKNSKEKSIFGIVK